MKKTITILLLILAFAGPLHAQRTSKGQYLFSGAAITSFAGAGADLSFGIYQKHSYWNAGLVFDNAAIPVNNTSENAVFTKLMPTASYMFRIYGTHNRSFSIYGGGGLQFGLEFLDIYCSLTQETYSSMLAQGYSSTRFVYGGFARVELEFFPWRSWALYMPLSANLTANSKSGSIFTVSAGLGVRFN